MSVFLPERVYHGTTDKYLPELLKNLIDPTKWRTNRDFGKGFYTTIDLTQAKDWAEKALSKSIDRVYPVVLQMRFNSYSAIKHRIYLGPSLEWAEYVLKNRIDNVSDDEIMVVTGPLADNDTGEIVKQYLQSEGNGIQWFYNQITHDEQENRLSGLQLGNQIAFIDPDAARSILELDGYWIYEDKTKGWVFRE